MTLFDTVALYLGYTVMGLAALALASILILVGLCYVFAVVQMVRLAHDHHDTERKKAAQLAADPSLADEVNDIQPNYWKPRPDWLKARPDGKPYRGLGRVWKMVTAMHNLAREQHNFTSRDSGRYIPFVPWSKDREPERYIG